MKTTAYKMGRRKVKVHNNHIIGDVIGTVKDVTGFTKNLRTTDNNLIRTRDKIIAYFKNAKVSQQAMDAALIKNKMRHDDIPNQKIGGTYDKEWTRLYQYVIDVFNNIGRDDLAELFERTVPVYSPATHDISYIPELLSGKIRAIPSAATPQDVASEIANEEIAKTDRTQRAHDLKTETQSSRILKPFVPTMRAAVQASGYVAPKDVDALGLLFYEKVVKPASASTYDSNFLDEVIVDSILHFIATVQQKRAAGEPMPELYEKIADRATQLQEKGGQIVEQQAGNKLGSFIVDNIIWIVVVLGLMFFLAARGSK